MFPWLRHRLRESRSARAAEVAAFDVKPVAECIAECERTAAPFYKVGEIAALREVARLGLGGVAHEVADAVREYVVYKQSLGMIYKGRALKLNAFARFVGPIELDKVTPEMVRNFLDGHGAVTTEWFNKFWVLNTFFRFAIARGYATENPLPRTKPKSPREFRPYIYSVEEVKKMIQVVDCRHRGRWHLEPRTVRTLLLLLYGTGLRIGEAINRNVGRVSRDRRSPSSEC